MHACNTRAIEDFIILINEDEQSAVMKGRGRYGQVCVDIMNIAFKLMFNLQTCCITITIVTPQFKF